MRINQIGALLGLYSDPRRKNSPSMAQKAHKGLLTLTATFSGLDDCNISLTNSL